MGAGRVSWLTANERGGALPASWYAEATPPDPAAPPLAGDLRVETCVIGAGFTGLSAALHLARAGRSVALLEAHRVGWGASGRIGGQISAGFNRGFDALAARLGPARARALWALSADAVTLARALIAAHAPEADFRAG